MSESTDFDLNFVGRTMPNSYWWLARAGGHHEYENGTRGILHFFKSSLTSDENDYVPTSRVSCIHVLLRRMTPAPQSARLRLHTS
jgi:hypothetical protein